MTYQCEHQHDSTSHEPSLPRLGNVSACGDNESRGMTEGVENARLLPLRSMKYLTWIALALLMTAHDAARAQGTPEGKGKLQYVAKAGPPLTLIDSSDPRFDRELEANFPGVFAMDSVKAALPYMVILRNDTVLTVRAYEVRWEDVATEQDGANSLDDLKATAVTTPLELRWPSGNKIQDRSIRPGEERVVTPWSNVRRDELSFLNPSFAQTLQPAGPRQGLKAHVDCVVYGDGSFDGPNKSRLLLTYFITRDAQHDEALTILRQLRLKPGDPELASQLARRTDIGGSPSFSSSRPMATYKRARAVAAQEFSQILQNGHYRAVEAMASELVSTMPPGERFTKLAEPYRQATFTLGEVKVKAEE